MRRVLIVAYYFPPLGGIGSLRAVSFASHLPEFGWEPTVLAPANGAYHRDPSLSAQGIAVVRSHSLELSRSGKRVLGAGGSDTAPGQPGRFGSAARELARRFLYFPDAQIGWYPAGVLSGRRTGRRGDFDAIFSSSFPITSHLIARRLARSSGLPWVAEFRDPWSEALPPGDPNRARAQRVERGLAGEAAALVMTSPTWSAEHGRRWGRPVTTITNGCSEEPVSADPPADLILTYMGSYYPDIQDLRTVWAAVAELRQARPETPVRVRFIGEPPAALRDDIRTHGLDDIFEVTGYLAAGEAAEKLAASSMLLAAGPRDDRPALRGWLPAKLFDYLASGVPIIWVGSTPNDGADLLRDQPGCRVLGPTDADGVLAALQGLAGQRYARDVDRFTRRGLARALADVLDQALTASRPR